ncbi:MAG TPA: helix-turn-helix domain-containing protein [Candidatus Acidoferrales bacterium]|nr:helix-turn-helix domain-containing protein [Candidatus Acidoferrales bacterium]
MSKGNFGEHLRREREMRGVSLDEITSATRIGTRFLQALENEQWDQLPGGIFNRGFVRAVAHYLGLDEEAILGEYTLATGDTGAISMVPPVRTTPANRTPLIAEGRSRSMLWVAGILIVALLAAAGFYGWRRHLAKKNAARDASAPVALEVPTPDTLRSVLHERASAETALAARRI